MNQDIDYILRNWECKPSGGIVQVRMVQARDGRQVLQMRIDLGILQLELQGRPDGAQPHGHDTYLSYLREQARRAGKAFVLNEEQAQEADREFFQYYQRRMCWLQLRQYAKAVADADHTLAFMDFVKDHSPSEEYTQAHEQYRGFVLFQRTQAAAAMQVEREAPEAAVDEIRQGLDRLRLFFAEFDLEEQMEENDMVQHLRKFEVSLRKDYNIGATLQEQLERAVAEEDYEKAARLRDQLRGRQ